MNAITSDAPHPTRASHPAGKAPSRYRRRTIVAAVGAAFLGLYVLGVGWFANTLQDDMARTLQLAPAVEDVAHR